MHARWHAPWVVAGMALVAPARAQTGTLPPRPAVGPATATKFPTVVTMTLPNGLRLGVVENHALPVVAVRVGLAGGVLLDQSGKEGCWSLMTSLLREGTTMRSAASLSADAAELGTQITWSPSIGLS